MIGEVDETVSIGSSKVLVEKKGCGYLIQAICAVQHAIPDVKLTVIGDGPRRSELEDSAKRLSVHCEFVGPQIASTLREYLRQADVFRVPRVTAPDGDSEGFGIVFLEAQAAGVPVVSFRHGGIPEAVQDGVSGLLAPQVSVDELSRNICSFLDESRPAARGGRSGHVPGRSGSDPIYWSQKLRDGRGHQRAWTHRAITKQLKSHTR